MAMNVLVSSGVVTCEMKAMSSDASGWRLPCVSSGEPSPAAVVVSSSEPQAGRLRRSGSDSELLPGERGSSLFMGVSSRGKGTGRRSSSELQRRLEKHGAAGPLHAKEVVDARVSDVLH